MLKIPVGRYGSAYKLMKAIQSVIKEHFGRNDDFRLDIDTNPKNTVIKVTPSNLLIYVAEKLDSPWNLFGVSIDVQPNKLIEFENHELLSNIVPAFLYVNIAENS